MELAYKIYSSPELHKKFLYYFKYMKIQVQQDILLLPAKSLGLQ